MLVTWRSPRHPFSRDRSAPAQTERFFPARLYSSVLLLHWASFEICWHSIQNCVQGNASRRLELISFATAHAPPILARTDAAKRLLDFLQALPILSVGKEGEFLFVRTRSAICKVRLHILVIMQCPQLLAVRSIRCAALFALKEACALILSDVTTDSDPVETFCLRSPQARL